MNWVAIERYLFSYDLHWSVLRQGRDDDNRTALLLTLLLTMTLPAFVFNSYLVEGKGTILTYRIQLLAISARLRLKPEPSCHQYRQPFTNAQGKPPHYPPASSSYFLPSPMPRSRIADIGSKGHLPGSPTEISALESVVRPLMFSDPQTARYLTYQDNRNLSHRFQACHIPKPRKHQSKCSA